MHNLNIILYCFCFLQDIKLMHLNAAVQSRMKRVAVMKLGVWADISFQRMKLGCLVGCVLHFAPRQIGYENMFFPWMLHIMDFFVWFVVFVCVFCFKFIFKFLQKKINKCALHILLLKSRCGVSVPFTPHWITECRGVSWEIPNLFLMGSHTWTSQTT